MRDMVGSLVVVTIPISDQFRTNFVSISDQFRIKLGHLNSIAFVINESTRVPGFTPDYTSRNLSDHSLQPKPSK